MTHLLRRNSGHHLRLEPPHQKPAPHHQSPAPPHRASPRPPQVSRATFGGGGRRHRGEAGGSGGEGEAWRGRRAAAARVSLGSPAWGRREGEGT
jgi:hypothetical protein